MKQKVSSIDYQTCSYLSAVTAEFYTAGRTIYHTGLSGLLYIARLFTGPPWNDPESSIKSLGTPLEQFSELHYTPTGPLHRFLKLDFTTRDPPAPTLERSATPLQKTPISTEEGEATGVEIIIMEATISSKAQAFRKQLI